MSSIIQVYTGPWINHSRGAILGATITLTTRDAAFLLALLAVVVTTAGSSFWKILSYIAHQLRSSSGPHNAIFYQHQAVLKNSGTALDAAWKFTRVSFAWRKHSRWWQFWRSQNLLFTVLGLVVAAAFGVASIFSSQVTKAAGNEVLINSANCGFWEFTNSSGGKLFDWDLKTLNESRTAANYANNCYGTGNNKTAQCSTFFAAEITWATNENASCPFAEGTCLLSPTAAYEMDTGPLDSHDVLGLDAKESERIAIRKVATCAPLHMAPYAISVNRTLGGPMVDEYLQLYIGVVPGTGANWTYEYDTRAQFVSIGYDLQTLTAPAGSSAGWTPIPEFNRTDADVSMFFLAANSISYSYPNSDPFFGAQIEMDLPGVVDNITIPEYLPNILVTTIGCADQFQICNPNRSGSDGESMLCTPLGPVLALPEASTRIGLNPYQVSTVETIVLSMRSSNMFYSVSGRGSSALKAQNTVFTLTQVSQLPDNQWQNELSGWFAISLASLQEYLFEKALGPTDVLALGGSINFPSDVYGAALCKRQMVRNVSGYQNFSTLGVAIILIVGFTLVILGLVIDIVVGYVQRAIYKRHFARLSWSSDGYLQLQRMAYEGAGYDDWEGCADEVPVSREIQSAGQQLGGLDIWDPEHPRLAKSAAYPASPLDQGSPQDALKMGLLANQVPVLEPDES